MYSHLTHCNIFVGYMIACSNSTDLKRTFRFTCSCHLFQQKSESVVYCKRLPSHTGQEQACSRFTRLFVRSWPCQKWPNTQENGCCLPPSDHIQSKILFQTKQDQERGMNGPASLLHSWHWVLSFLSTRIEKSNEIAFNVFHTNSLPEWYTDLERFVSFFTYLWFLVRQFLP